MRILLVVLPRSPHSARLANLLVTGGWEVHVAAAYPSALLPEFSRTVVVHRAPADTVVGRLRQRAVDRCRLAAARTVLRACEAVWRVTGIDVDPTRVAIGRADVPPAAKVDGLDFAAIANITTPNAPSRASWLADLVDTLRPDVVHSFTIHQTSYLTLAAKLLARRPFPPWIVSNWGSDIHFYGRMEQYSKAISTVLAHCDYYTAECGRDVALARELGFAGRVLGVAPIGGGFDVQRFRALRRPGPTSARRLIMVKGDQNTIGRALVALRALVLCADALAGYRVAVYLSSADVRLAAELLQHDIGLPVEVLPFLPHDDLMRHHGRARVSIGLSLTDGISTSAMEAMIMGAFPIQSETSCLDEWIRDGSTGMLVHPEDPVGVAAAIRRAVSDDGLVDAAVAANDRVVAERLDASALNKRILEMYDRLAGDLQRR